MYREAIINIMKYGEEMTKKSVTKKRKCENERNERNESSVINEK